MYNPEQVNSVPGSSFGDKYVLGFRGGSGFIRAVMSVPLSVCRCRPAPPSVAPWLMFNGNAQLTGVSPYLGPTSAANVRSVLTTGNTASSPLITSDGTMYIIGGDGYVHALANSGAGNEKWTYTLPSYAPYGPAAISSDGKLYYASDKLYAIDITTTGLSASRLSCKMEGTTASVGDRCGGHGRR